MKSSRLLLISVAVVTGAGAFIVMSGREPPPAPVAAPTAAPAPAMETVEVLVAAAELPMGQTVKAPDMRWQTWPRAAAGDAFLQRANAPTALEDTVGSIVRSPFLSGEPIRREKLIKANGSGFLSAILPSGMRAAAISIDARGSNTAGGFILPNDRVDVLRTSRDDEASRNGSDVQTAETILTNIRVLAVGQTVQERNGERVVTGDTATLELTPAQAEAVTLAQKVGQISLTLRSLADAGQVGPQAASEPQAEGGVTVVRYGVAKQMPRK